MTVRPIDSRDVEAILAIQRSSPEVAQWNAPDYVRAVAGDMAGWVTDDNGVVSGFLIARLAAGDLEILNFAVRADVRRRGLGAALLREVLSWGAAQHAQRALLEVRASNRVALDFYGRYGFRTAGRRPRYYVAPVDDALLLTAEIASLAGNMQL